MNTAIVHELLSISEIRQKFFEILAPYLENEFDGITGFIENYTLRDMLEDTNEEATVSNINKLTNLSLNPAHYVKAGIEEKTKIFKELYVLRSHLFSHWNKAIDSNFVQYDEIIESTKSVKSGSVIVWCDEPYLIENDINAEESATSYSVTGELIGKFVFGMENESHYLIGELPLPE